MRFLCIILAAGLLAVRPVPVRGELANGIQAIVHDSVVTYHEVRAQNDLTADLVIRQYRSDPALLEKKLSELQHENIDKLRDRLLILHEFSTAGYTLPESVIDDLVQERIRSRFGDRMTLTKTLQAEGMTFESFRKQVREQFIVDQLRLKNVSSDKIIISPHKIQAYYETHRDDFKVEDEVKLRVIVLKAGPSADEAASTRRLAEDLLSELKAGHSFSELATQYSQGSQRNQGGDWGWWERSHLTKGLSDVAFSLPTNRCSNVFSRSLGDDYWVVQYTNGVPMIGRHYGVDTGSNKQKMFEERPLATVETLTNLPPQQEFYLLLAEDAHTAHFKPLAEVRDEIDKSLFLDEQNRLEKQWMDKLKKKTFWRYF